MPAADQGQYSVHCPTAYPVKEVGGLTAEKCRMFQRSKGFALFRGWKLKLVLTRTKVSFERSAKGSILNFRSASYPETFCMFAPAQASPSRWVRHAVWAQRGDLT
jgi:hypothetical protein